jgi:hypothetical protein
MGIGGNTSADLIDRLHRSANNTIALAEKTGVSMELVIVEWNMGNSIIDYEDILPRTKIPIRVIHTYELHDTIPNPRGMNYFEWFPKNIGIRRAEGEFVLSTNPDDIFTEDTFRFFSKKLLRRGTFYRADRHDYRHGKVFLVCRCNGTFWPGLSIEQMNKRNDKGTVAYSQDTTHYCAAGDFTLMSKEDWFAIKGNPELDYNHTIDGQTLFLARQAGMDQIILPYPIYHPDHARTLNQGYFPGWDDNFPFGIENRDFGFPDMKFQETRIEGFDPPVAAGLPSMPPVGAPCWQDWPNLIAEGHVLIEITDPRMIEKNGQYVYLAEKYARYWEKVGKAKILLTNPFK